MSQTKALTERIYALAAKSGRSPTTLSRELLGNGMRLAEIESGNSTLTMDLYNRVEEKLAELERDLAA